MDFIYDTLSIVLSAVLGVGAAFSVVMTSQRERNFLSGQYYRWVLYAVGLSLGAPLVMQWGNPSQISFVDAFLLRSFYIGWGKVLIAHSMLAGVLLGGLVAVLIRVKRNAA